MAYIESAVRIQSIDSPECIAIERTRPQIISLFKLNASEAARQLSQADLLHDQSVNDPESMVKSVLGRIRSDPLKFTNLLTTLQSLDGTKNVVIAVRRAYFGTPYFGEYKKRSIIKEKKPLPPSNQAQIQKILKFVHEVVVLLVTIKDNEKVATLYYMDPPTYEGEPFATMPIVWYDNDTRREVNLGMFGGHKTALIQAKMGDDCRKEVEDALNLMPTIQLVVAVGYAYGSKKYSIGDVLVSTTIDGVGNVKFDGGKLIFREGDNRFTRMEKRCFMVFTRQTETWCVEENFKCSTEGREPKIISGQFISAPWLINDENLLGKVFENDPISIGGEMEGQVIASIYHDFRTRPPPQTRLLDIIIIKGVADFADGDKEDAKQWQFTAAMAAAGYTKYKLAETRGNVWKYVPNEIAGQCAGGITSERSISAGKYGTSETANQHASDTTAKQSISAGIKHVSKLMPSDFSAEIYYYNNHHHPKTRQWILDDLNKWKSSSYDRNAKVCLITGDPGMGKSVLAGKLCILEQQQSTLAGCFFFQHQKMRRNSPEKLVHTLAYQFCENIPHYLENIVDQVQGDDVSSMKTAELFTVLIVEPLHKLDRSQKRTFSVIIDAIDECEFEFRNDLLNLINREFIKLPHWLHVIITARSDQKIVQKLKRLKPHFQLNPSDPRNVADIKMYLHDILEEKMPAEEVNSGVDLLVKKSEGMFLYFHYVSEAILSYSTLALSQLQPLLPDGIDDYYEVNFRRIYQKLGKNKYFTLLQAVIAARTDFPQALIRPLLKTDEVETVQIISIVSDILPIHDKSVHVFHKSVRDWVTDAKLAEDLLVNPSLGHDDVARLCFRKFEEIKSSCHTLSEMLLDSSCRYVIENMVYHFCNATDSELEKDFVCILFDLRYIYYRLHYSQGSARDLLDDYEEARKTSYKLSSLIDAYFAFVRRNAEHLASMPHLVYQCSLNEPDEISRRLNIQMYAQNLSECFPEIVLCLELINKPHKSTTALTKCTCDSEILSLKVLPHSQNVACIDVNGNIYIWSKHSAEQLHKDKTRGYNFAFQCSTTPDGKCICYGDISQGITPDGDTVPLIPNAKSNATTCCFSPCGKFMLAWSCYSDGILRLLDKVQGTSETEYVVELWQVNDGKCMRLESNTKREYRPTSACFSHDSSLIICGHRDGSITVWEMKAGTQKAILYTNGTVVKQGSSRQFIQSNNDPVKALSYSSDGHYFAVCCNQGVLLWDAPALCLICKLPCMLQNETCITCSFSPSSDKLAAGSSNGWIFVWNVQATSKKPYPLNVATQPSGSSDGITKVAFDDDDNIICAIGNSLCVYGFESLKDAGPRSEIPTAQHPHVAESSKFMPNSGVVLTLGNSHICSWEAITGKLLMTKKLPGSGHMMNISKQLIMIFGEPYMIYLIDKETLKLQQTISHCDFDSECYEDNPDAPAGIAHCTISKDGMIAYGTGDGVLKILDGHDYSITKVVHAHQTCITYIQFFPHGMAFISADDEGNVIKWEILRGKKIELKKVPLVKHNDSVEQIVISQSGIYPQRVATCSTDQLLHLYDGQTCDLIKKLKGHDSDVLKVALSGDGKVIASGDHNGNIIVWDSFTGQKLNHMSYKATGSILDLYFVKNDKYLCARGSNMNALVSYSVSKAVAVSVLSFTSSLRTTTASSFSNTSGIQEDIILCGLADGTLKFVKVFEVQEDNIIKKREAPNEAHGSITEDSKRGEGTKVAKKD